jgi:site-specific DNA-methyltransferase (adenine-specific)/adenine-specific DNA-methyltransferase
MDPKIRKQLIKILKEGRDIPTSFKEVLFPEEKRKMEYELVYANKEREEDILAETMRVPLQPVKTFCNDKKTKDGWTNKLIFGDNLQVLKELMYDPEVKGKVRLVYIDPPFATKQEFRGSQDQKAYQDKIAGAKFLEFLRKRLIFLREILADDGSIYVHLDWKKGHYVKVLMDEIFGEQNFRNEVVWHYRRWTAKSDRFQNMHEIILYYAKNRSQVLFNKIPLKLDEYLLERKEEKGWNSNTIQTKNGRIRQLLVYDSKKFEQAVKEGRVRPEEWDRVVYAEDRGIAPNDVLQIPIINPVADERTGFPTQKPEALLEVLVRASSNPGDIVLDAFAGSGTTGAVAEKLGRRWIMIDSSKLAIYTIQKRLLNLRKEIGNKGEKLTPKPFTLYNAGLYDYQKIKELPWEQYRDFALKLFQCRDEKHTISGIDLDGYLGSYDVLVFNYQKYKDITLDYGFIDNLHSVLGDKIGKWFFIITPAANVQFLEDYVEKDGIKYFILRIPYSIISEIHQKGFTSIKQPTDERAVNDIMEAVGFDFIQIPKVRCEYYLKRSKGIGPLKLDKGKLEAVIKIKTFESNTLSREAQKLKNLESLSMVMIDYDYNGKVFDLDDVFYAEDLKQQGYEIRFDPNKIKGQMMIIYCDIFGNEKREIKTLKDFKK